MNQPEHARLLCDAERYLSALHGSVARHDNLAANYGCAGCELRDRITAELHAVPAEVAPATDRAALRDRIARLMEGRDFDFEMLEFATDVVLALPASVDRATVLEEAADFVRGLLLTRTSITTAGLEAELRRMAAESVPADTGRADTETQDQARQMLTRMQAGAATHDLDYLLCLLARWTASSEGRDVLVEDLIAAGYRLPHACGNCDGIDPNTCLMNPDRQPAVGAQQPTETRP
jgi:hypothetical protein